MFFYFRAFLFNSKEKEYLEDLPKKVKIKKTLQKKIKKLYNKINKKLLILEIEINIIHNVIDYKPDML